MKGFKKLVPLAVLLVTLLVLVDIINAKKKEPNKKEVENKKYNQEVNSQNEKYEKKNKYESSKERRLKQSTGTFEEDSKVETKKYKIKKGTKYTTKDGRTPSQFEDKNPKITKTYQKLKKFKVVEDNPVQNSASGKSESKKTKQKVEKQETMDEVYKKSVKKTSKKKVSQEDKIQRIVEDDLNMLENGENIIDKEENSASNLKKKKYKLVELILEEDAEENNEGNETFIEISSDDGELGNIQKTERDDAENIRTTQTFKLPKHKKTTKVFVEEDSDEDVTVSEEFSGSELDEDSSVDESFSSKYEYPEPLQTCQILPEDPERQGPKKLTLYVIEEEVNGNIKKRVVSEEDGVTMCEVSDLLREHYYAGLP